MTRTTPAEDLAFIAQAARDAAGIAMGFFCREPKVWWKENNSPVSEADYAVDAFLTERLRDARPDYGWVSEETEPEENPATVERFFIVDPIDGTRSFLRGEDTWCVAVAVVENGRPIAAVIDVPAREEIFTAVSGGKALRNGEALKLPEEGPGTGLTLSIPDSIRRTIGPEAMAGINLAKNVPSLAYRLALVADGRLDGTLVRPRANDWDIAAGDLILERAGGRLVGTDGTARRYEIVPRRHGVLVAGADFALGRLLSLVGENGRP